jgi:hypothetical protein
VHTFNSSRGGNRTRTSITAQGIFLPTTTFVAPFGFVVWTLSQPYRVPDLGNTRQVSTRSHRWASLGIAILQVSPNLSVNAT